MMLTGAHSTLKLGHQKRHHFNLTMKKIYGNTKPPNGALINWAHPLSKGLVGHWLMNERMGDKIYDLSGNKNTGSLINISHPSTATSGWNPGKFGCTLNFNGVNNYVNAGTGGSVTGNLTITAWIKRGTNNAWRTIVSKGESTQDYAHNYVLWLSTTNTLYLAFGNNDGVTDRDFETTNAIDTNWHHIVAIINSATDMKIYVDGVSQAGTYGGSTSTVLTPNSKKLLIGSSSTTTEFWIGTIDEVRIYDRGYKRLLSALSAAEVIQLYKEPFCIFNR